MDDISDEQLMSQVRDGEVETLGFLYERHRTKLFNFFVRLTGERAFSEDLVQESFLRMLRHRETFKADHRFTPWMYQIGRNAYIDALRKRKGFHGAQVSDETQQKIPSEALAPDQVSFRKEEMEILQAALAQLPFELREPLILSRFENLRYEEIATILECGVGAVKMRIHRALKALRESYSSLAKTKSL